MIQSRWCVLGVVVGVLAICASALGQGPLGTGFTYQGRLTDGGQAFTGAADLTFTLYDAETGGTALGTHALPGTAVTDGVFTVTLNGGGEFGAGAFAGGERWLEVSVDGTVLSPRQRVAPTPAALHAAGPWQKVGPNLAYMGGSVGIGTTFPRFALTVRGVGANSDALQFQNADEEDLWHLSTREGGLEFAESGLANYRLFLERGGNVGIGVSNPTARLHVDGNIRVADDADLLGVDRIVGSGDLRLSGNDDPIGDVDLYIHDDGRITHRIPYANTSFAITSIGHEYALWVGTEQLTGLFAVFADGRLDANGLRNIGDYRNVQWNQSNGEIGYDTSSRRYKANIRPLRADFGAVLGLEAKTYTRIEGDPSRWEIGYIAEEVHEAGLRPLVEYDPQGRPDGVNYEKMAVYLAEVVKQQQMQIEAMEARLRRLEGR